VDQFLEVTLWEPPSAAIDVGKIWGARFSIEGTWKYSQFSWHIIWSKTGGVIKDLGGDLQEISLAD